MKATPAIPASRELTVSLEKGHGAPFAERWVAITEQEHIELRHRASYWEAQYKKPGSNRT